MRYLCKPTNGNLGTRSAVAAIRSCVLTRTSMSCRAAAAAHLMSKSSVSRWRRKYAHPTELLKLPSDTSFVQQRNCVIAKNRKNCFGTTELTVLSEVIEEHPKASLRQLTRFFMNKLNSKDDTQQSRFARSVHLNTIREHRKQIAKYLPALEKPHLTIANQNQRFKYTNFMVEDLNLFQIPLEACAPHPFDKIIFLDEKIFYLIHETNHKKGIWITKNKCGSTDRCYTRSLFGSEPVWIEVLAGFSRHYVTDMLVIQSSDRLHKQNFLDYMRRLEYIVLGADRVYGRGNYAVVQDSCGGHYSQRWPLFKSSIFEGVHFLDHPSNSPDLNLAETYWLHMENHLRQTDLSTVSTSDQLIGKVYESFCHCTQTRWWPRMRLRIISNFLEVHNRKGKNEYNERRLYQHLKRAIPPAAYTMPST